MRKKIMCEVSDDALRQLIRKNQIVLSGKQKRYLKLKRVLDFSCALLALLVLLPLFLLISVAIKLDSPREQVIFRQERIGQYNQIFMLLKFRSMKKDTPELGTNEFWNAEQYITRIGRFIRRTSLDELPQLWSVLCGKMSLVGARPLILREDEVHYLRNYYGIYQLKPGITGLAQVNGRDVMSNYEKVWWDRAYIQNVSFSMDCKILWKTIRKVITAEGIADEKDKKNDQISCDLVETSVHICMSGPEHSN